MAQILGLPKLSPTMEEGVLVRWTKKEGDKVSPGDLVAEVETDKANMDFNVEDAGTILKLLVKEGETVKLGAPVMILGKPGEDTSALEAEAKGGGNSAAKAAPAKAAPNADGPVAKAVADGEKPPAAKAGAKGAEATESSGAKSAATKADAGAKSAAGAKSDAGAKSADAAKGTASAKGASTAAATAGKILASPLAKTLAIELGIDLRTVEGTGPGGRIVERDVKAAAEGGSTGTRGGVTAEETTETASEPAAETALAVRHARQMVPDTDADFDDIPASNMRKRIASRLTEAKRDVPHFYLMRKLDAAPLLGFRQRLNDLLGDRGKVSVNDLIIKAVALALRRVPECNASWAGESIHRFHRVHIGVAVAIEDGLVTPVIRDADQKGIGAIAAEVKDLAERAKTKKLKGHEITGSTFTVSNLGMFGIERFTAIINPPEGGILAIGTTVDEPVVGKDGAIVAGKRMTVTMSCDHRVIDGALGARWLQAFAELFEKPESLAL
jgi:pyruvate dehydrogenase E2 component (dihydrolipoamide acetyltransferase)